MKIKRLWIAMAILAVSLACNFSANVTPETPALPSPTPQPPVIIQVTPTQSYFAAEEANAGTHLYWMSPNEVGCDASDDSNFAQYRQKELFFSADFNTVSYSNRDYVQVAEHQYQAINEDGKPLVLAFSEHGYILYVYEPGTDPAIDEWCLTFSFTLAE